jgi:hypothetical protein
MVSTHTATLTEAERDALAQTYEGCRPGWAQRGRRPCDG